MNFITARERSGACHASLPTSSLKRKQKIKTAFQELCNLMRSCDEIFQHTHTHAHAVLRVPTENFTQTTETAAPVFQ